MSQARVSKLEALLARVAVRRAGPRLEAVPMAEPQVAEPQMAEPHVSAPIHPEEAVGAAPVFETPTLSAAPTADTSAHEASAPAVAESRAVLLVDVPESARVGDGAPPTPSVIDALAAIRPEILDAEAPGERLSPMRQAEPETVVAAAPALVPPSPEGDAPALDEPDPDEPTVAIAVPAASRALHPELTSAGDPIVPEPAPPEPVLDLVAPAARAPEAVPEAPRVSVPPPRMSLPVRPSLPSPELVPEALPFTLLTERPEAAPPEQDSLEIAGISLQQMPVLELPTSPLRLELSAPPSDLIEVAAQLDAVQTAVTLVPSAAPGEPRGSQGVSLIPPVLAPSIAILAGRDVEPDPHGPTTTNGLSPAAARGEPIAGERPLLTHSPVSVTAPLPARAPESFGRLLERSLSLRPRN